MTHASGSRELPLAVGGPVLAADCANCFGLCCVALPFKASTDFAVDKAAGFPCPNLRDDHRCSVHDRLRPAGFSGCAVFDCFGAGQQVSQVSFQGRDWRHFPETAAQMFEVLAVMRQLHELLYYLRDAIALATGPGFGPAAHPDPAADLVAELRTESDTLRALTGRPPAALLDADVAGHRARIGPLLARTSALVRQSGPGAGSGAGNEPVDHSGADLIGADLAGARLQRATLRGAYLIGADLQQADLRRCDLLGADLRGAKLAGADLRDAVFLTQAQLDSARGDRSTLLSAPLHRPAHWTSETGGA